MQTIEVNKHKIKVYSSNETLSIKRYQKFQKFLMIENEVGSSFIDYDTRTSRAIEFLNKGMVDEAVIELENRRQMVYNAFEEFSPKNFALALLIHSIDDVVYTNYSDEGLKEILDRLDEIGFDKAKLDETVSEVKKKIEFQREIYFKSASKNSGEIERNGAILKKLKADVNLILDDNEENKKALFDSEKEILELQKPNIWNIYIDGNMEIEMEVEFEKFLLTISEHTTENINEISVFRFDTLIEYLKEKNSKNGRSDN